MLSSHTDFSEDEFQRAEVGKGRLEQVETHECRKPEPVGVMEVGEGQADEDEGTGKPANDTFHTVRQVNGQCIMLESNAPITAP